MSVQSLPKIDPHHHLWDLEQNDYPWLQKPMPGRMYGDYSAMCRSYLIADFRRDSEPHNVVKSVHVQANWNQADPVGETRWVQSVADAHGFPHGIVAHADLAADDVAGVLDAHRAYANMRGIRHIVGHTDDPGCNRPSPLEDPAWERGYRLLEARELSFDLQAFPQQMLAFVSIAERYPDVTVIVCHTGFPWDRSDDGKKAWRAGMSALARLPNAYAKLSGPGMVMPDWTVERFGAYIHETVDMFGPERCMFASNVPPDALRKTYDEIYQGFYAWAERYSEDERRQMFYGVAERVYRI